MEGDPRNRRPRKKVSIENRKSKVTIDDLACLPDDFSWYGDLRKMIPHVLRGRDITELSERIVQARSRGSAVVWMMGGHVVKCGFGGIIGDLIRRDLITGVAMNGACAIHDVELAMWGKTSEDVEEGLRLGEYGMAEETSEFFNGAARACLQDDIGLGEALGRNLAGADPPNRNASIITSAHDMDIPLTVHVAIGTDIVHLHENADGKGIGKGTMRDFRRFASIIAGLNGGVVLNIGSAVILPEVFLKGLALARSTGADLGDFTTANFDMHSLYRPAVNIVQRAKNLGATSYEFLGHHELLLPVFFASILSKLSS